MTELRQLKLALWCCLFLVGCDAKHWPGLGGAKPVPDARVLIELPEAQTLDKLYPLFEEAALLGGYNHSFGHTGSLTVEELLAESFQGSRASIKWTESPNQNSVLVHKVKFSIKYINRQEQNPTKKASNTVTFIFGKDSSDSFTREEWETFFLYYREILPKVFKDEGTELSISRHPAIFTDRDLLVQIHTETDYEIPVRYLEN